jgi:hypothetical protein
MDKSSEWPPYYSGPKESTFALGVISSSYGRLESAFHAIFVTATNTTSAFASILLPKINNDVKIALIEQSMQLSVFAADHQEHIAHFLAGYRSMVHNRNVLMHSQIFPGGIGTSILIKTQKDGKTVGCAVTLSELRQIADDMNAFHAYGLALTNCINLPKISHIFGVTNPPPPELLALPDKPALPNRLDYTSDPIPIPRR